MSPKSAAPLRVALVTLGCDKNTVDSERYLAELISYGAEPTEDLADAEVILVNTCGFIDAAKRESIEALLAERCGDHVTYAHWESIDQAEKAAGEPQGRPRVKLCTVPELLDAAGIAVKG